MNGTDSTPEKNTGKSAAAENSLERTNMQMKAETQTIAKTKIETKTPNETNSNLPEPDAKSTPAQAPGAPPSDAPVKKIAQPHASPQMEAYFASLKEGLDAAMEMAQHARSQGLDPERFVEITPARDVAARVEGIVGPKGIAAVIRELEAGGKGRDMVAYEVMMKILRGELGEGEPQKLIDQGVRTAVSILTEGVLVAPTEGIASIRIHSPQSGKPHDGNPDGSSYLAVYFAGPIRSAGGTVAALAVVLADAARRHFKLAEYRPAETEIERYVEEINLYNDRCAHLQYKPTDDEIRHIVRKCPVCVEGEPTEAMEVSVYRDLPRMATNRVRGGIALVVCEGIAQKSSKVLRYAGKINLDWTFLEALAKGLKKSSASQFELKPDPKFLEEIVAGRPIFSYPMRPGGFRLRYGRTRASGIAAKAIHPASMYILDAFPAIGTQFKIERPGKGAVVSPCDSILGPVVKLKDGSVVEVNSSVQARTIGPDVAEVLFLGDILVSYGDFLKSNHALVPSGIVEEWWEQMAKAKGIEVKKTPGASEAFKLSRASALPLHPRYTFFWHDITSAQMEELARWLGTGKLAFDLFGPLKSMSLESSPAKRVLELLCVPHTVHGGQIAIEGNLALALLESTGLLKDGEKIMSPKRFETGFDTGRSTLENVRALSGVNVMAKAPVYVGTRMGRPEKSRERKMAPPIHVLFPLGAVGKNRSVPRVYEHMRNDEKKEGRGIEVEVARLKCRACGKVNHQLNCAWCGSECVWQRACPQCGRTSNAEECGTCKARTEFYEKRAIDVVKAVEETKKRLNLSSLPDMKGVQGLISAYKIPELLDKGVLRAKHGVTIFRDSTCRHDSTDMPLTHFTPREVKVPVQKLVALGYTHDIQGKALTGPDQMLALKVQDVLISADGAKFFTKVAAYMDELLVEVYQMRPYYKLKKEEDLIGQLAVGLSPHTSAGVLVRIIGFTSAHVGFAHPYFHCAKRRNCDGDEDCLILLMDALVNFSRKFMPASRGGTMDSPLVLTTRIDPTEVDDEVHSMETVGAYPLSFYEAAAKFSSPSEVQIPTVKNSLNKPEQYEDLHYTHEVRSIEDGPLMSSYISLEKKMTSKIAAEFALEDKIRAVDAADVARRVLLSHFLPDMYGNLRSFSRQMFRCGDCNAKYRRVPLSGKCRRCNGKLLLTIYKGGIEKYLQPSRDLVDRYKLPNYMRQRLDLIQKDIDSIFTNEKSRQVGLADFM
ncbi:MAG: DNA polymerase II large subunit [Candidatus Micrarchaeota archaeon]